MRDALGVVLIVLVLLLLGVLMALSLSPETPDAGRPTATLDCRPGQLASRAVRTTPDLISLDATFQSIRDAENLLCLDLPEPVIADGWRVRQVEVLREATSLEELEISDLAYSLIGIEFLNEPLDLAFHVYAELGTKPFEEEFEPVETSRYDPGVPVRLDGGDGLLRFNDRGAFLVTWSQDGFNFYATGRREGVPQVLPVLESFE